MMHVHVVYGDGTDMYMKMNRDDMELKMVRDGGDMEMGMIRR